MKEEVDMYYRFTSEEEPSEAQLKRLMEEVLENVKKKNAGMQELILENIRKEYEKAKKMFPQP